MKGSKGQSVILILCFLFFLQIVYTSGTKMQVKVHAEVVNPVDGHHDTTNMFHFTFDSKKANVPILMPKSYAGRLYA